MICKNKTVLPNDKCNLSCNSGVCQIINNKKQCKCPPQFMGVHCEHYICSGYCQNKGICHVVQTIKGDSFESYEPKCTCAPKWTGHKCEISLTQCQKRCHNGGACNLSEPGEEKCSCPPAFKGNKCEHCADLECKNEGTCRKTVAGKSTCECSQRYVGRSCEIDQCQNCSGHGNCTLYDISSTKCQCEPGFYGKICEHQVSCADDYCRNGGTCVNTGSFKRCECPIRYSGDRCDKDLCLTTNPPAG
jgi:low-density lipoprotein receptor-related protein 1 (alpha-2-macroglobulin receptor)